MHPTYQTPAWISQSTCTTPRKTLLCILQKIPCREQDANGVFVRQLSQTRMRERPISNGWTCAKTKEEISDSIIRIINYCCSYLWVKFLFNICIADGHYILPLVLQRHHSIGQSATLLGEIIQERPENKEWNEWRKFLRPLCYEGTKNLQHSLRKWTTTIQSPKWLWRFVYSSEIKMLYQGY